MLPTQKTAPKTSLSDLTILLYGPSKIGKTTLCSQADGALFLATEAGLNSLNVYQIPIGSWENFLASCHEIADGKHSFRTICVDTIDNLHRYCSEYICQKFKIEHESDLGYGKGYALINNEFYRVLNKLALLPYGLFLVSHSQEKEIETRTGKLMRITTTLPEKARKTVLAMADIVLFCDFEVTPGADGKPVSRRVMRTKPNLHYEAGDRTGRLPDVIDLDFQKFIEAYEGARAAATQTPPTTTKPVPATAPAKSRSSPSARPEPSANPITKETRAS